MPFLYIFLPCALCYWSLLFVVYVLFLFWSCSHVLVGSFADVPLIFPCPADNVPDWQPRILLGMVKARSVNVENTTTTTTTTTTGFLPISAAASIYLFKPPYVIGPVPSLSGHAIAYRWRSLPRVRRHRATSPQGNSSNGCYLFITTMKQLMCACLFPHPLQVLYVRMVTHTHYFIHYWYKVGMLKVLMQPTPEGRS